MSINNKNCNFIYYALLMCQSLEELRNLVKKYTSSVLYTAPKNEFQWIYNREVIARF